MYARIDACPKTNLSAAKEYIEVIEQIEKTKDSQKLQKLEEKRAELHWEFIGLLKEQGLVIKTETMQQE